MREMEVPMAKALPRWAKDPREIGMIAQWPQDWRVYHRHGLESIVASGRVAPALLLEPFPGTADPILQAFPGPGDTPWFYYIAGRLLAGTGVEILLKGLYLKRGYSIRDPNDRRKQSLALLGSEDDKMFNPRISASFGTLLRRHNLQLIDGVGGFEALTVAKWWRDQAAHAAVSHTGDAGSHLVRLGMALRALHDRLMSDADEAHAKEMDKILREGRPIHLAE
jgi:hypothetical protein